MTISARVIKQLIERSEDGQFTDEDLRQFMENPALWRGLVMPIAEEPRGGHLPVGGHPYRDPAPSGVWLDAYLAREERVYARIREQCGVVLPWPRERFAAAIEERGREAIETWERKFGLRVGTIPEYAVVPDAPFQPVKLGTWFYESVAAGKIGNLENGAFVPDREAFRLHPAVILFDPRAKPEYANGRQMWRGDKKFLGNLIARLRKEGELPHHDWCSLSSRFGISPDDWEQVVRPALSEFLGVAWRLERAVEWNFLCQAHPDFPRVKDGETNTWNQFQEYFGGARYRLDGGLRELGGLVDVFWSVADDRSDDWSPRPLGVLATGA